jgi:hypothetical protein
VTSFPDSLYSPRAQVAQQVIALTVLAIFATALTIKIGLALAIVVAGSAFIGFFCWRATNLRHPITPERTAILFLLTTAALHVHMFEEHFRAFGPAMSRLFGIAFPDSRFLLVFVFILPVVYYVTAIGLLLRIPMAAFVAWFIFIGPGTAEFTHFVFPLIRPALEPANPAVISATIHGVPIEGMANHWFSVTGVYYFPGMYTAVLPMIPGIYSIVWLFRHRSRVDGR